MPEDGFIGFKFKETQTTLSKTLSERLAEDIVQQSIMSHLDPIKTTATEKMRIAEEPALDWDGNVPPDFSEDEGFLL